MISLAVFALINLAAASSGAVFKPGKWYAGLGKPPWTPPNWAFPVVWSVLFTLNALSGWLVWRAAGADAALPLAIYGGSLMLNAAWSALFFGRKRMDWALADVAALALSILVTAALFWPISTTAALLQLPYLLWVLIATALNARVLQLNPQQSPS